MYIDRISEKILLLTDCVRDPSVFKDEGWEKGTVAAAAVATVVVTTSSDGIQREKDRVYTMFARLKKGIRVSRIYAEEISCLWLKVYD